MSKVDVTRFLQILLLKYSSYHLEPCSFSLPKLCASLRSQVRCHLHLPLPLLSSPHLRGFCTHAGHSHSVCAVKFSHFLRFSQKAVNRARKATNNYIRPRPRCPDHTWHTQPLSAPVANCFSFTTRCYKELPAGSQASNGRLV